jgi:ABC-type oligopeptide transport system ATPase subunit
MNKGKIEEVADADVLYSNPKRIYQKLIEAIPQRRKLDCIRLN